MRILHFDVVRQLGAGGMGEVYLAEDTKLNRKVALKLLPSEVCESAERLQRFKSEAQSLASLNHPNIVTIFSVEQQHGRPFLVMELVDGETLAERLEKKSFKLEEFFDVATALADALAAAHEKGIIHRDLKPSNVMLARDGTAKILDFGLAKLGLGKGAVIASGATTDPLTREGRVVGTPSFMSPEQLEGRPVDHRSDIFSLGIILYRMATGRRPFGGTTEAEIVSSILRDTPDPADKVQPKLPHHLSRLLRLCLEKNVDHRLQSAHDLRNELLELRRELTTGEIPVRQPTLRRSQTGRRWLAIAVVAAAMASLTVLGTQQLRKSPGSAAEGDEIRISGEAGELLHQGYLMEMRGDTRDDLAAAEDRYRRALELQPGEPLIQARLAMVLARIQRQYPVAGRRQEIRELIEKASAADPDLPLIHVVEANLLIEEDPVAAEAEGRRAIELDARDYRGYTVVGKALIAQDRIEAGLAQLRQGVELAGADVRARLALAGALMNHNRTNEAVTEYEEILAYAPDYPNALNNLAMTYARSGRDLDAVPLFKRLWRVRRYEAAANNLGMIYKNQGRLDEAVHWLQLAYEVDPDKPVIPHTLGEVYEGLGQMETAGQWFEMAFDSYSQDLEAGGERAKNLGMRAVCAAKLGQFEQARQDALAAVEITPGHKYRLFNAAQVYALAGDREQAYRYVERALAAGSERGDFVSDPSFAEFLEEARFRVLIESEDSS